MTGLGTFREGRSPSGGFGTPLESPETSSRTPLGWVKRCYEMLRDLYGSEGHQGGSEGHQEPMG